MIELYQSPVVFEETPHKYWLNGKELGGVTSMLRRQLPSLYDGVPDFVLKKAAAFGSQVHDDIQFADESGMVMSPLAGKYLQMRKAEGLEIIENEYTISDEEHIASKIDQVMYDGDGIVLGDAKTTAKEKGIDDLPHRESVTYQLNVYRVLFEKYNPHLKVKRLVAFWLDKHDAENSKVYDVEFIPDEVIWDMIEADKKGKVFTSYLPIVAASGVPAELIKLENVIISITSSLKFYEEKKKELQAKFLQAMKAHNVKSWDTPNMTITRILPTKKKTFDAKLFKEEHEDLYNKYLKESEVSGSVRFTLKNK